ncbi:hypothetical protein F5B20DRAFT_359193 [Whalleya microplaca]|nr:hypothetical protein F5B20DRAFT_359193 [Whalleya microplaca]
MSPHMEEWLGGDRSASTAAGGYEYDLQPSTGRTVPRGHVPSSSYASSTATGSEYSAGYGSYPSESSYAPSMYAPSTAESAYTTYPASNASVYHPAPANYPTLPCEFVGMAYCEETFHPEDTEAWIEHIATVHLLNKLPSKAVCWFCDEFTFNSRDEQVQGDRRQNFHNRMYHIRNHIVYDGKTVHDIRPDFYMLEHLHKYGLISEQMYQYYKKWHEKVPSNHTGHIRRNDYLPPKRVQQQELEGRVIVQNDSRSRHRRHRH